VWLGLRHGTFTCVRRQLFSYSNTVIHIWQITVHSSVKDFLFMHFLYVYLTYGLSMVLGDYIDSGYIELDLSCCSHCIVPSRDSFAEALLHTVPTTAALLPGICFFVKHRVGAKDCNPRIPNFWDPSCFNQS